MAFLARYGNIQPSESDALTEAEAWQLAKEIDEFVSQDQKALMDIVFGAARAIATSVSSSVVSALSAIARAR